MTEKSKNSKGLCRYLVMINFYRSFVHKSAQTLMILYDLQAKQLPHNAPINMTTEKEKSFITSKNDLSQATLLVYPVPDAKIFLAVYASDMAVASVLHQYFLMAVKFPLVFSLNVLIMHKSNGAYPAESY